MQFASLPASTALRLIIPFGFGFFLSMFTRAVSNITKQPIQLELMLNEEAISLALGSAFFIAFAIAQLPVGILLDRFDPRKVNASLFLLAAAGAVVMAYSESGVMLSGGRILMGLGFAAGLMGSLKVYALWFPRERLPTLNSLQFMIGLLGSWVATKPTEWLLRIMEWRELYLLFAAITLLSSLLMVLIPPRHETSHSGETLLEQLRGLLQVYTDGYFWRVAPWLFVSMGVTQGLNTLYLFSWLTDVAAFDVSRAANGVALVTIVSAANFLVMGPLVEYLQRRGYGPLWVPVVGQSMAMLMLLALAIQIQVAVVPQWMFWMVMAGTSTLAFSAFSQAFPTAMIGRVYTAFNLMGFLCTALSQWLVGRVLDMYPRTELGASPEGYSMAFALLLGFQLVAAFWFVLAYRLGVGSRTLLQKQAF